MRKKGFACNNPSCSWRSTNMDPHRPNCPYGPLPPQPSDEQVNHPKHYTFGKIEVIEAIEDWKLNFHRGQVVKYVARAGRKDPSKEVEDLEKAQFYLGREISLLKASK